VVSPNLAIQVNAAAAAFLFLFLLSKVSIVDSQKLILQNTKIHSKR